MIETSGPEGGGVELLLEIRLEFLLPGSPQEMVKIRKKIK
jgi:hypothetical protein